MIFRTFSLTLVSSGPVTGPQEEELRGFFTRKLNEYRESRKDDAASFIHRYPAVQFRMIRKIPTALGINEGAETLRLIADENREILMGGNTYRIIPESPAVQDAEFGLTDTPRSYEFVTPWLALNQENSRKFYKLKGKIERDDFIRKLLLGSIGSLAKSVGYTVPGPISGDVNIHFQKDRIDGVGVMTFTGKFQVNFQIPDYFGIGQSVSRGFGAVRQITREIHGSRD